MSYEEWRISFQSSEKAAMAAYGSVLALQSRVAELEKDAARYRWIMDYDDFEEVIEVLSLGSDDAIDRAMSREA